MPYHRLPHLEKYLTRTYLGNRTAVHQASYGCPFRCKFCGVAGVAQGRQKCETPERTAQILTYLQKQYAIDAVQFYDNNFFLRESDSRELADRITPLKLNWWCEGRIDILLRYSDETLRALRALASLWSFWVRNQARITFWNRWRSSLPARKLWILPSAFVRSALCPSFLL